MKRFLTLILLSLTLTTSLYAQNEQALRRTIEQLEASIEKEEKELAKLKKKQRLQAAPRQLACFTNRETKRPHCRARQAD